MLMIGRALARVEQELNARIRESASASSVVDELEGRSFGIDVEGLGLRLVLRVDGGRVAVTRYGAGAPPDASIAGTPLDLSGLLGDDPLRRIRRSRAALTGSTHVAEKFAELLRLARPDAEEELARWIGDVAAHEIGRAVRRAAGWAARSTEALRLDLTEYLEEESRTLPAPHEAKALYADIDRLRDDVERAAERLERVVRLAAAERSS